MVPSSDDPPTLSEAVVEAVADAEDTDPVQLEPPLYEVVDPDALDDLVAGDQTDLSVRFRYCGYDVTVHGDGSVDLEDA